MLGLLAAGFPIGSLRPCHRDGSLLQNRTEKSKERCCCTAEACHCPVGSRQDCGEDKVKQKNASLRGRLRARQELLMRQGAPLTPVIGRAFRAAALSPANSCSSAGGDNVAVGRFDTRPDRGEFWARLHTRTRAEDASGRRRRAC
jgi:hypothetical protein